MAMEQSIIDQHALLKQACETWMREALTVLNTVPLPYKQEMQYTFRENGYSGSGTVRKVDVTQLFRLYDSSLFVSSAFEEIAAVIRQLPEVSAILFAIFSAIVPADVEQQNAHLQQHLSVFLREYLLIADQPVFSVDIFNAIYTKFDDYIFSSQSFEAIWLVHLKNLHLETDRILLDRGISIRQTTYEEKVQALNNPYDLFPTPFHRFASTYLEIHETTDRFTQPDQQKASTITQAVVLALRLLKPNPVGIASYLWDVPNQPFIQWRGTKVESMLSSLTFVGDKYIFCEDDAKAFPKLLRRAKKGVSK